MDIFELLGIVNKQPEVTARSLTMDYINGKIDSDTYIQRMKELDELNRRTD